MAHKTAGLRGKLRLLTIIGFSLVLLVCGGIVALFLFDIEDVIYARGKIASEIAYDIIGHMDGRVIRLNFEEGDDVESSRCSTRSCTTSSGSASRPSSGNTRPSSR